ncbi:MAG: response regulator transcription factor, partial [Mycobacterium sp.]|nr:response regulator transcription factor [Mycobacterium sp.]
PTTVRTHVQHIYEKLGVNDRAAAVAEAMRRRLVE